VKISEVGRRWRVGQCEAVDKDGVRVDEEICDELALII